VDMRERDSRTRNPIAQIRENQSNRKSRRRRKEAWTLGREYLRKKETDNNHRIEIKIDVDLPEKEWSSRVLATRRQGIGKKKSGVRKKARELRLE